MISGRSAAAIHSASVRDRLRIGMHRRGRRARLDRRGGLGSGADKRLARQHEIDRPARRRHGDFIGARHDVADLARHAQLVIPLHQLAQHAGLVEHLLRPVDRSVARSRTLPFSVIGRAPGGQDQRHAVAGEIGEVVDGVGGADVDVHHHRLRPAGHQIGAVRHADREVFVRHQDRPGHLGVGLCARA